MDILAGKFGVVVLCRFPAHPFNEDGSCLSGSPAPNLKFGPYEVDTRAGELRKQGSKIRLQEKPLRVLEALAAQPGVLVTREELRKHLWPDDTFVDFETGLNTAVSKLREALNDDAEHPRYIETVPRRGYRFLAPVENGEREERARLHEPPPMVLFRQISAGPQRGDESAGDEMGQDHADNSEQAEEPLHARGFYARLSRSWLAMLALLVLVCAAGGYLAWRQSRMRSATNPARVMIAVLPFENLTGDPAQGRGFSLGMRQRLGIAAAMLADPPVLMMDEPFNGMDPEGIVWMRGFLRSLAAQGRAVLVSSHLMSELQDTADHLVVVGRGQVVADTSVAELIAAASGGRVTVRTTARAEATTVLAHAGATIAATGQDTSIISGLAAEKIVALLGESGLPFLRMNPIENSSAL